MTELYWQNTANFLIFLLPAVFLCLSSLREVLRVPMWRAAAEAGFAVTAYSLLALKLGIDYLNAGVLLLLVCAYFYLRHRTRLAPLRVLFVFLAITSMVFFLTVMANDLAAVIADNPPKDSIDLQPAPEAVTLLENICYFVLFAVVTPLLYILLRRFIVPVVQDKRITGWGQICVLPLAYCLLVFRAALPTRTYPSQRLIFIALCAALAVYSYTMLLQLLRRNAEASLHAQRAQNAENIIQIQGAEYNHLAQQISQMHQLRHDQRHQYTVLQGLAAEGDTEQLMMYLEQLTGDLPSVDYKQYCQNQALNALLNHYAAEAENAGVRLELQLDVPEYLGRISNTDLCVAMGNLLENALEACARMQPGSTRWVRVKAALHGQKGHHLVLVVDNSFTPPLEYDRKNGDYCSQKRPGQKGIGMQSVQAVCQRYSGFCEFEALETTFQASVTLQL